MTGDCAYTYHLHGRVYHLFESTRWEDDEWQHEGFEVRDSSGVVLLHAIPSHTMPAFRWEDHIHEDYYGRELPPHALEIHRCLGAIGELPWTEADEHQYIAAVTAHKLEEARGY